VIYSEGKRLESLSLKLMDLILLQEDRFEMVPHELGAIVAEIRPALEIMAKEKGICIVTDCEEGSLLVDPDLIKVLIFNLVDNAIKASTENQTVELHTFWRGSHYIVQIADQGIGIAEEHRDKIFEPFYMADKARTRSSNGAGLGLSICQSVARLHHADIYIAGNEKQGTIVEVDFDSFQSKGGEHP